MMLFKNFRIRRRLCLMGCGTPSSIRVDLRVGPYRYRKHYCPEHAYYGLYWAGQAGARIYKDTGAR